MNLKKVLLTSALAAAMLLSTTACSDTAPQSSNSGTSGVSVQTSETDKTTVKNYSVDNDEKVKKMLDSVTLNGKPLKIPYKLSDLGEGFSFDEDVDVYEKDGKEYAFTTLTYNNELLSSASLKSYTKTQSNNEFTANSIGFSVVYSGPHNDFVKIGNIDINSTANDVIKEFGEPTKQKTTNDGGVYYYENNDGDFVSFWYTSNNELQKAMVLRG